MKRKRAEKFFTLGRNGNQLGCRSLWKWVTSLQVDHHSQVPLVNCIGWLSLPITDHRPKFKLPVTVWFKGYSLFDSVDVDRPIYMWEEGCTAIEVLVSDFGIYFITINA